MPRFQGAIPGDPQRAWQRRPNTVFINPLHLAPESTIAFAGGVECNDHHRIWAALDRVRAKHPDMVLLHGGSPRGAEKIAACWADARKVPQIVFKPDWRALLCSRHLA
jgi:hypothetical protein